MKRKNYLSLLIFIATQFSIKIAISQSPVLSVQNRNYTVTNTLLVPGKTTEDQLNTLTIQETSQAVSYFSYDGNPVQTVITKGSPQQRDIVSFSIYDNYGRQATNYLPFVSSESNGVFKASLPSTEYSNFYNTTSTKVAVDGSPFSKSIFEPSPISRTIQQGSMGAAWQPTTGASKFLAYGTNTTNETKKWSIIDLGNSKYSLYYLFYGASELSVTTSTDEQSLVTKEYKDFEGKVVCSKVQVNAAQWAETSYVYDDRGDLRFMVPPEAVRIAEQQVTSSGGLPSSYTLVSQSTLLTADFLHATTFLYVEGATVTLFASTLSYPNNLIVRQFPQSVTSILANQYTYQYLYDNLHKRIAEKVPGKDWKYFVYDNRDQLVLAQDGNQRATNQYAFTKYDDLGRPVLSGITTIAGTIDQIRTTVENQTVLNEQIGAAVLGYTNNAYPSVSNPNEYLVATYYDDYSTCTLCQDLNFQFASSEPWVSSSNEPFQKFNRVLGKTVASSVKILGTNNWLHTVSYYNRQGQVIQTIGSNHLGGSDRVSFLYDFIGKKLEEIQTLINYNSGGITTLRKRYTYAHAGRVTKVYHQINSQREIVLSALEYNELGQVVKKRLHSENEGITYLQALDYQYNIRGWLTNFNNLAPEPGDPVDYYGMQLNYNDAVANAGNTTRTDGLVSAIRWQNDLSGKQRLYNFTYDNLKQLTGATHKMKPPAGLWNKENNFYNETGITYDFNGNIKTLNRNTDFFNGASNVADPIDQLTYDYGAGGNQLQFVKEGIASTNKDEGFKDGGTNLSTDPDYTYDLNGNVTKDQNKSIASITYYYNNLPKRVTFGDGSYLENTYDAAGIKLTRVYSKAGTTTTTDYVGSLVLLNGQVLLLNHEEGRITAPTYSNLIPNKEAASLSGFNAASSSVTLSTANSLGQNYVFATATASGALGIYPIQTTKGNTLPVRAGDTYTFSVLGYQTAIDNITWANVTNATLDLGVTITPTTTTTTWGSGASSLERLPAGINGWVEFKALTQEQAIGLSENDLNANWQSVQFGFFITGSGANFTYSIIESGFTITTAASLATSDVLRVERVGTIIYYKKNGSTVYSSTSSSTTSLIVDITLNKNAYLIIPKISFAKPAAGLEASLYLNSNIGTPNELSNRENFKIPNLYSNETFSTVTFTIPDGMTSISVGVRWYNGATNGSSVYINRVALYKTNFEYNYFLNDQVGNTRVVLQTSPATLTYTATMESENLADESQKFQSMNSSYLVVSPGNTTPGGDEVIKLNALNRIGPAKSIKVYPGDKINANAMSYYISQGGFTKASSATMVNALAQVFQGAAGIPGDPGSIFSNINQAYTTSGFGLSADKGASYPSAFLNYILFDKDYNPLGGQSVAISSIANTPQPVTLPEVAATEVGYLFIYLSYDNATGGDVFFDDLKITVQESPVIQVNNYYPFGMQSYTWLREGETDNAYLYQGKELIAQTGWHDFGSRMYYGDLGRWFSTDPAGQFSSPYNAMGNNPVMSIDPDGRFAWFIPIIIGAVVGATTGGIIADNNGQDWWKGAIVGAFAGAALGAALAPALGATGISIATAAAHSTAWSLTTSTIYSATAGAALDLASGGEGWQGALSGASTSLTGQLFSTAGVSLLAKGQKLGSGFAKLAWQGLSTTASSIAGNLASGRDAFSSLNVGVGPFTLPFRDGEFSTNPLDHINNGLTIRSNLRGLRGVLLRQSKFEFDEGSLSWGFRDLRIDEGVRKYGEQWISSKATERPSLSGWLAPYSGGDQFGTRFFGNSPSEDGRSHEIIHTLFRRFNGDSYLTWFFGWRYSTLDGRLAEKLSGVSHGWRY